MAPEEFDIDTGVSEFSFCQGNSAIRGNGDPTDNNDNSALQNKEEFIGIETRSHRFMSDDSMNVENPPSDAFSLNRQEQPLDLLQTTASDRPNFTGIFFPRTPLQQEEPRFGMINENYLSPKKPENREKENESMNSLPQSASFKKTKKQMDCEAMPSSGLKYSKMRPTGIRRQKE